MGQGQYSAADVDVRLPPGYEDAKPVLRVVRSQPLPQQPGLSVVSSQPLPSQSAGVDYDALAAKHGGTIVLPPGYEDAKPVKQGQYSASDIDALAAKYGGTWQPDPSTAQPVNPAWNPDPSTATPASGTDQFAAIKQKYGLPDGVDLSQPIFRQNPAVAAKMNPSAFVRAYAEANQLATIGPREGNAATQWLQDLEGDVKNGTGNTFIGRALQKMGARGADVGVSEKAGDFMASPILGTARALRGTTELPSHPWQGTKDTVGGAMDAAQIPSALGFGESMEGASKLAGDAQSAFQASRKASQLASQAKAATDEWQKINDVLGVTAKGIRIGKGATSLDQAATMPGRAVSNLGITSDELAKMSPIQRMAALFPHYQQAGAAIDTATQAATDAGKTFDAGNSAFGVLKRVTNPDLQQKAVDSFNALGKSLSDPITNWRNVTPSQALELRRALQGGARFGPSGDLNSLGAIRGQLYNAVSSDLHSAVPTFGKLDQNYSDLRGAIDAAQNTVSNVASKAPPPTTAQKAAQFVRSEVVPAAVKYGIGGAVGYGGYTALKSLLGQ